MKKLKHQQIIKDWLLDIANIEEQIKQKNKTAMKKRNIEIHDISQNEALKFLKGG